VLAVAAGDPQIVAVISQAPFTDGLAVIRQIPYRTLKRIGLAWALDLVAARLGAKPVHLRVIGRPGAVAIMAQPDAVPGFTALLDPDTRWSNEVTARALMPVVFFRPCRLAGRLSMPVLFCVCDGDLATPPGPSLQAARAAPRGELRRYPYGHFDIYNDPQAKVDQVEFLRRVFGS
jgi:pimeloyl-ACP methyl ester carboxylesterase